ncbi:MaoC family dehydratase N-terminal domain-containing protein [Aeromicrobium sp. YIM 150415]|uniref:FAS1-like dehydratase domain-containing protein n=1 Tax=Aeromicrobium sp. YIM 150415 TaxID=2803912 RepID=UPI001964E1E9|nr:MaoC family dehydratase N-terminal domain-containing protein [Aeromicrobium sp. YIM 150415]MBM9464029.1 MaoC family dehydratase N-terminal domain-containing protein [Aeromicrobium sp. YIM 150415]
MVALFDDLVELSEAWKPQSVRVEGVVDPASVLELADLLAVEAPGEGEPLRPMWHEVVLREDLDGVELGEDGHPAGSGVLPPLSGRQRLFGGGRVRVHHPLRVGEPAWRDMTVTSTALKQGAAGALLLVTETHRWFDTHGLAIDEERNIVYRRLPASPGRRSEAATTDTAVMELTPDASLLEQFSRLTGNRHRIHVDEKYAQEVEGHPSLLVHGPLTALLASETAFQVLGRPVTELAFRLRGPAYVGERLTFFVATGATGDDLEVTGWAGEHEYVSAHVAA